LNRVNSILGIQSFQINPTKYNNPNTIPGPLRFQINTTIESKTILQALSVSFPLAAPLKNLYVAREYFKKQVEQETKKLEEKKAKEEASGSKLNPKR
jgi:hypothetical protein